jgi:hypothetical protein
MADFAELPGLAAKELFPTQAPPITDSLVEFPSLAPAKAAETAEVLPKKPTPLPRPIVTTSMSSADAAPKSRPMTPIGKFDKAEKLMLENEVPSSSTNTAAAFNELSSASLSQKKPLVISLRKESITRQKLAFQLSSPSIADVDAATLPSTSSVTPSRAESPSTVPSTPVVGQSESSLGKTAKKRAEKKSKIAKKKEMEQEIKAVVEESLEVEERSPIIGRKKKTKKVGAGAIPSAFASRVASSAAPPIKEKKKEKEDTEAGAAIKTKKAVSTPELKVEKEVKVRTIKITKRRLDKDLGTFVQDTLLHHKDTFAHYKDALAHDSRKQKSSVPMFEVAFGPSHLGGSLKPALYQEDTEDNLFRLGLETLADVMKHTSLTKSISTTSHMRSMDGVPLLQSPNMKTLERLAAPSSKAMEDLLATPLTKEEVRTLKNGKPIRRSLVSFGKDSSGLAARVMRTPMGTVVKHLSEKEEDKLIELEKRIIPTLGRGESLEDVVHTRRLFKLQSVLFGKVTVPKVGDPFYVPAPTKDEAQEVEEETNIITHGPDFAKKSPAEVVNKFFMSGEEGEYRLRDTNIPEGVEHSPKDLEALWQNVVSWREKGRAMGLLDVVDTPEEVSLKWQAEKKRSEVLAEKYNGVMKRNVKGMAHTVFMLEAMASKESVEVKLSGQYKLGNHVIELGC